MKSPKVKPPPETTEEIALRQRQINDLSKQNEEENQRIKGLLRSQAAGRLFSPRGGSARRAQGQRAIPAGQLPKGQGGAPNLAYTSRAFAAIPKKK